MRPRGPGNEDGVLGHVVKHGLDSISKTWTLLVKHGLY